MGGVLAKSDASLDSFEADFRRESSRLLGSLVRAFGVSHLTLAEDTVQETFHRAMILWPVHGRPPNPSAWLHRVARNLAIDAIRRERIFVNEAALDSIEADAAEDKFLDDELRLLFLCCHPRLSIETQIALTLKSLCGFGVREVAKALLSHEASVAQRIGRAKRALAGACFELPAGDAAASRLAAVLHTLYLLFNEGYSRHTGPELTDPALCDEAIVLVSRLAKTSFGAIPKTHALLALMLLHSSRLPARMDINGCLCLLEDQNRKRWDQSRIRAGLEHLGLSATGAELSPFHCEAAIAACHAVAPSFAESDWRAILGHYDDLMRLRAGPIAALNRAVALSMVEGPNKGLEALEEISEHPSLRSYYLLPATRARLMERLGRIEEAVEQYRVAHSQATNEAERRFLVQRQAALKGQLAEK